MRNAILVAAVSAFVILSAPAQTHTACGNGDFESGLDAGEWSGENGVVLRNGDPRFGLFAPGLLPGEAAGSLNAASSHQTWVDASAPDPVVGISQVAPGGSTHAVRIGNSVCDARADMLTKTFVVSAAQGVIRFSYAVVLQDGGHRNAEQSSFLVRVLDATGTPIQGVVKLVGDADRLVAGDSALVRKSGTNFYYRDWTRATIDLSRSIGKTVTVQFITKDCAEGGHFAYAYIDDFCDTGCGAMLDVTPPGCDCGAGVLRVGYALPTGAGVTGSVVLRLDIWQGGVLVTAATSTSPILTDGTTYDFAIDPALVGGFDMIVTGTFMLGGATCEIRSVGSPTDGIVPGRDNDHHADCGTPGCGTGFNAIVNGDFESGNVGFTSAFAPATVPGSVLPREYAVLSSPEALAIARTWRATSHFACDAGGRFLVVNGDTGEEGRRMVWSQTVSVIGGQDYRFCANFRNLPICGFDVLPELEFRFSTSPADSTSFVVDSGFELCSDPCTEPCSEPCHWQLKSRDLHIPPGVTTLTCEIWLDETKAGDGNDLAIDDVSLYVKNGCGALE